MLRATCVLASNSSTAGEVPDGSQQAADLVERRDQGCSCTPGCIVAPGVTEVGLHPLSFGQPSSLCPTSFPYPGFRAGQASDGPSDDSRSLTATAATICGAAGVLGQRAYKAGWVGGRARRQQPSGLVAVGGHDSSWRSLRTVELYDQQSDSWHHGPALSTGVSFAACALVDQEVYLVGGTPLCSQVACLGARRGRAGSREKEGATHAAWEACPNLSLARAHAGVASLDGAVRGGAHASMRLLLRVLCVRVCVRACVWCYLCMSALCVCTRI